jgi:hypothetical protein
VAGNPGQIIPKYSEPQPIHTFGSNVATATAAAATISLPAQGAGLGNVLSGLLVSYIGTVSGGNIQVSDGAIPVVNMDLGAGSLFLDFPYPILGSPNAPMTITLASGGSGVAGKVTALGVDVQPTTSQYGQMDFSYNTNSGLEPAVL